MHSFKDGLRKAILTTTMLAVATSFFTGCSKTSEISDSDIYSSSISSSLNTSSTSSTSGDIGTDPIEVKKDAYADMSFDMRYKHWYDNPEVITKQQETLKLAQTGTSTGTKQLGIFPLYEDSSGREYFISGRQPVYVPGSTDMHGLTQTRDENGKMHYPHLTGITDGSYLAEFNEATKDDGEKQKTDYASYASCTEFAKFAGGKVYQVFINNLDTGATYSTEDGGMPITKWLAKFNLATVDTSDAASPIIYMNTGMGPITLVFSNITDEGDFYGEWLVNYIEDGFEMAARRSEVSVYGDTIYFTPNAIERVLGYYIHVYENAINIVTDNEDLADEESAFPSLLPTQSTDPTTSDVPAQPKPESSSSSSSRPVSSSSSSSSSKPVESKPVASSSSSSSNKPGSGKPSNPKKGDTYVDENGETWTYSPLGTWIPKGNGGGMTGDASDCDPLKDGKPIGHM